MLAFFLPLHGLFVAQSGFLFWFFIFFLARCLSFGHGRIQSLVFQSHRTSHFRYMQHNYYSSFYRITVQVFIRLGLASVFLTCSKLDIGPKLVII
jgi:hypothetical protein